MRFIIVGIISFYALGATVAISEVQTEAELQLTIGAILTLSGNFAAAGEDSRRGIEAALADAKNRSLVRFVYSDSRNEPATALSEYQRLLNIAGVSAVYTHRSSIGMALNPQSKNDRLPLLGAVGHQDFAASNSFAIQAWPKTHDEGGFVANQFSQRNYKRVAVLYTEDEWTSSVSEGFRARAADLDLDVVFDEAVLPAEQDFRAQLVKLKTTAPDAIYFNLLLPQIAPALKQVRAAHVGGDFFGNFYFAKLEVREAAGAETLEGVRFTELDNRLGHLRSLLGKDEDPPGLAVAAYVSTMLLLQAAGDTPRPHNAHTLMEALARQKQIRTPDGVYEVKDRSILFPLVTKLVRNGKVVSEISH